ncbi:MAG: hypothetical protein ACJ77M_11210 [Thermoleophilaceae bacterium]
MARRLSLVALALVLAAAVPAGAQAAVSLTKVQLQPTTTAGGAHPDVTVDTAFDENPTSDDVKSLSVLLPQGLIGNPTAVDHCSQANFQADQCPATSKVGSAQVTAVVTVPPGIDTTQTSPGDLYNLDTQAGEPARLGMVIRPTAIGVITLPKIFLQSGVTIGPDTNYGLLSKFDNLPRTDGGMDIRITESKLTLNGNGSHGAFITNPTDCSRPATMVVTVTSYDQPNANVSGNGAFAPTDCDKLPFQPAISGVVGGVNLTAKGKSPPLNVTISMPPGQANQSGTKVLLPAVIGPNISQVTRACPIASFQAGTCPPESRMGTAIAMSPGLPAIQGPVLLIASPSGGLPQLALQLSGVVPLSLLADTGLEGGRLTNTLNGLPDLPVASFQLLLQGGPGLVMNQVDLCAPGAGATIDGTFTAHSGRTAAVSGPLLVQGCVPGRASAIDKPRASIGVRFGSRGGVLTAHFKAGRGAPALSRAALTLASGLKGKRDGLKVTAARKLGRKALSLRGRTLTAKLLRGRKGAVSVALRWRGIKASAKVARRLSARTPLKFVVLITDTSGRKTKLRVPVKPVVARK